MFALEHNPTMTRILLPVSIGLILCIIGVAVIAPILMLADPDGMGRVIGVPWWLYLPLSVGLVLLLSNWVRDVLSVRSAYSERYELDDLGIRVTDRRGQTESYSWADVTEAFMPQQFIIKLSVPSRSAPLVLVDDTVFLRNRKFLDIERLVEGRIQVPLRKRRWL